MQQDLPIRDTDSKTLFPCYNRVDISFSYGKGSYLYDEANQAYLDFTSGIAVNALGHCHPYLVEQLTDQANKLWHISNLFESNLQQQLSSRLCNHSGASRVFFTNSGTETVECSIKTARHYYFAKGKGEKHNIISFSGAFHGRTIGALAATGRKNYLEGFEPTAGGFYHLDYNDADYNDQGNIIKEQLTKLAPKSCAIIIEPIQGEGGVRSIAPEFLKLLRQFCTDNDMLLILDEIQVGMGRTGQMFAFQHLDIKPDILCLAKALGGGFPIGACLAYNDIALDMVPGTHGSTFGGNPLAMRSALAVLDIIEQDDFLVQVRRKAEILKEKLLALISRHSNLLIELRGHGLMLGIKCAIEVPKLVNACREAKLLTLNSNDNVMRLLPPLNISESEISEAIEKLEIALNSLS